MADLQAQSDTRVMKFKHDTLTVQCAVPRRSWTKVQRLDELVAQAFDLTAAELDYIAGYDIKYRMGQESDPDD
jgi:hypothetical protein